MRQVETLSGAQAPGRAGMDNWINFMGNQLEVLKSSLATLEQDISGLSQAKGDRLHGLEEVQAEVQYINAKANQADEAFRAASDQLNCVGLTFSDSHAKVSDQGTNIKKAWGGLPGGYCPCHTLELSVNVYLKSPGVCDWVQKLKGITTFLHRSGHRLTNLKGIQKRLDLQETRPPKTGNSVCWTYTHQSQESFQVSEPAILMYDVTHGL